MKIGTWLARYPVNPFSLFPTHVSPFSPSLSLARSFSLCDPASGIEFLDRPRREAFKGTREMWRIRR